MSDSSKVQKVFKLVEYKKRRYVSAHTHRTCRRGVSRALLESAKEVPGLGYTVATISSTV
jgi:hypothetical protein